MPYPVGPRISLAIGRSASDDNDCEQTLETPSRGREEFVGTRQN
jgi:hypothetical protein